jgi:Meiotically Up-regulated Gene 113 (MUG113) protein
MKYDDPCFVYFVTDETIVKIGWSTKPKKRIRALENEYKTKLRMALLIRSYAGAFLETHLHYQFRKHRLYGEWFAYNDDIKEFISHTAIEPLIYLSTKTPVHYPTKEKYWNYLHISTMCLMGECCFDPDTGESLVFRGEED